MTIPKNIVRYSVTLNMDGSKITVSKTVKIVEISGAIQSNLLLPKKTNVTDNSGSRIKIMVLNQFNPKITDG